MAVFEEKEKVGVIATEKSIPFNDLIFGLMTTSIKSLFCF